MRELTQIVPGVTDGGGSPTESGNMLLDHTMSRSFDLAAPKPQSLFFAPVRPARENNCPRCCRSRLRRSKAAPLASSDASSNPKSACAADGCGCRFA